jgi:ribosomal protein S18 acetylase RimI-like enzyme
VTLSSHPDGDCENHILPPHVAVRPARPADAPAIAALAGRAWRAAYAGLLAPSVLLALDPDEQTGEWRAYLDGLPEPDRVWVIGATAAVWGFARTGPCPDADLADGAGEVHGLYVEPDRIGSGLGRRLFGHAVADLGARHPRVVVWHFEANTRAERFYERAGFGPDGARRHSDFGVPELRRGRPAA